jgi:response regulator RpfG family c-di-GMP phosphodiesterase
VAEIQNMSGKNFDPALVSDFSKIIPDVLEIKNKYADEAVPENLLYNSG